MSAVVTQQQKVERLRKWAQILGNQLGRANTHLHFFLGLHSRYAELNEARDFWDYTLTAHVGMTIRDLGIIYDTHRDGVNLAKLLALIDPQPMDKPNRQKLQDFIGVAGKPSTDPAVNILREWRNNVVAHYNGMIATTDREDFCKKHPLEEPMLQGLIDKGFEIVEWCGQIACLSGGFPRFAEGKNGHSVVLDSLKSA